MAEQVAAAVVRLQRAVRANTQFRTRNKLERESESEQQIPAGVSLRMKGPRISCIYSIQKTA
jgi:hypothetical protein